MSRPLRSEFPGAAYPGMRYVSISRAILKYENEKEK